MTHDIEQIATEARSGFDLRARLTGRKLRTGSLTVYTDEVAGELHREAVADADRIKKSVREAFLDPETGEELRAGVPLDEVALADAEQRAAEAVATLDETALTFEWRAVPPIIEAEARRKSLAKFTIGTGPVSSADTPDFKDYFGAFIFAKAVRRFRDHESGNVVETFSLEDAQALQQFLPRTEWERLYGAFGKDQFQQAITHEATDTPDF